LNMKQFIDYPFELFKKIDIQDAYPLAERWLAAISALPGISAAEISGDLRRGRPAVTEVEIAAASPEPASAMAEIIRLAGGQQQFTQWDDRVVFHFENGIDLVIWLTGPAGFGSLLHATTGSQAHHQWLSLKAALKGLKYESGLIWRQDVPQAFADEAALYEHLDLPCVPPEIREGFLEGDWLFSAESHPLISGQDIIADLHVHTNRSDGKNSLAEMAEAAVSNGLALIAITDHSPGVLRGRYQDHSYLFEAHPEIDALNRKYTGTLEILKGVEVDIRLDGSLDLDDEVLACMDIVIASIHSAYDQPEEIITARYLRAISNPFVNIIGHPGGRLYPMVDVSDLDWDTIIPAAASQSVALEVNSHKAQPLFDEHKVRQAAEMGVLIAMDSDAHHTGMFADTRYGLFIARRAGLRKEQVLNAWTKEQIRSWLRKNR
jgi:DNA polymerase (family 10)